MTAQPHIGTIPQWTRGDRMRKALHHADVSVQEMADYLDVARNTVSTWINDRIEPSTQTMRLWAMRTGVPLEWLLTGTVPAPGDSDGGPSMSDSVTGQYSVAEPARRLSLVLPEPTQDDYELTA